MTKLENFFIKNAKSEYKKWTFAKEWKTAISLFYVLKYVTIFFSGFAGLFEVLNLFLPIIVNETISKIFAFALIILIELLTAFFLSKSFKFILRSDYITSIACLLFSFMLFGITFYTSTNGLAKRQSGIVDQTMTISTGSNIEISNIKEQTKNEITRLNQLIEIEKNNPQNWTKGKRNVLSASQLKSIQNYNEAILTAQKTQQKEIERLNVAMATKLLKNEIIVQNEASKYYNIVAIIMFLNFLVNGGLMFAWSRIYKETELSQLINEKVKDINDKLMSEMLNNTVTEIQKARYNIFNQIKIANIYNDESGMLKVEPEKKQIGFIKPKDNSINIEPIEKSNETVINNIDRNGERNGDRNGKEKTCKHCGKTFVHKHWNATYCSDECRIESWQLKTGKTFMKRK
jgi:hypothetical protein